MNFKPGVIRRGIGFLLDFAFLSIFFFPATYLYSGKWVMGPEEHLWGISDPICLVFLFIIFAYFIFMEAYVGWTLTSGATNHGGRSRKEKSLAMGGKQ